MTVDHLPRQDPEDPASILWWDDYAAQDRVPAGGYLLESGDPPPPGPFSVPASEYTSQEYFAQEIDAVWTKCWQVACRENDIPAVGDYLEYEVVGRSILIVRDTPSTIRAFRNACRHRATALIAGRGNAQCFVCPFHGWTYNRDGSVRRIPAAWDFAPHGIESLGLHPVRCETFDGWVFVNLDDGASSLRDFLGATVCRHLQSRPSERMWKACHIGTVVDANWKVMLEAFFEVYHTAQTHPTVAGWGADLQARYDRFGSHARMIAPTMVPGLLSGGQFTQREIIEEAIEFSRSFHLGGGDSAEMPDIPGDVSAREFMANAARGQLRGRGIELAPDVADAELIDAVLYHVFPNLLPFRNPAGHYVYRVLPLGTHPARCRFEVMHLVPIGDQPRPPDSPLRILENGQTFADCKELGEVGFLLQQDVDTGAAVQRGLAVADHIVLARRQEANIAHFHRTLGELIDVVSRTSDPALPWTGGGRRSRVT